jgi:hypothetical protein
VFSIFFPFARVVGEERYRFQNELKDVTRRTKRMKSQPKLNKSSETTIDVDWFLKGGVLW